MKKLLIILLSLSFLLPVVGQNDNITTKPATDNYRYKKQVDLDVEFLGFSIGYKKRVHNNWFVGGRIGAGLSYTKMNFNHHKSFNPSFYDDIFIETFHTQLLAQYAIKENIMVELGPRFSILREWLGEDIPIQTKIGISGAFYLGLKKVQIGIRIILFTPKLITSNYESNYANSLLILRIPLKKW